MIGNRNDFSTADPLVVYVDVENTILVPFLTGIQRVTRQLLARTAQFEEQGVRIVPVVRCTFCSGWRRISSAEQDRLRSFPAGGEPSRSAQNVLRVPGQLARRITPLWLVNGVRRLRDFARHCAGHGALAVGKLPPDAVFLDLDSSWHNPVDRRSLLKEMAENGTTIATVHYDIVPALFPDLVHPDTCRRFAIHLDAHLQHSSLFLCISETSRRALTEYATGQLQRPPPPTTVIALGADHLTDMSDATPLARWPEIRRYLLCVGTIEPRKNHSTAIRAFHSISDLYPDLGLVLAGKKGWMAEKLVAAITSDPLFDQRLIWLSAASDSEIGALYRSAFLVLVPSLYEGFGLPVTEALAAGKPVITTGEGALREAGMDLVDYFEAGNAAQLASLVRSYLDDPQHRSSRIERIMSSKIAAWDETCGQIALAITGLRGKTASGASVDDHPFPVQNCPER